MNLLNRFLGSEKAMHLLGLYCGAGAVLSNHPGSGVGWAA